MISRISNLRKGRDFNPREMVGNKQIVWLNCSKFVAILAVMLDHTNKILYQSSDIAYASYFSVELFVILSGMTSYLSDLRHEKESWRETFIRSCKKIVVSYCVAVVLYMLVGTRGFDLSQYIHYLISFSITGPHYFVLLYIQLMAVNRILYGLLRRCSHKMSGYCHEMIIMGGAIVLASWSIGNTNMLDVYGGGGKLFGGSYLILYFGGMLAMRHGWFEDTSVVKSAVMLVGAGSVWFILWRLVCRNGLFLEAYAPFGNGYNPPGITFMEFGICMLFITFGLFTLLGRITHAMRVIRFIAWCGSHSMYIFLYHKLFLDYFLAKYMGHLPETNILIARVVYLAVMIFGSILLGIILGQGKKYIREVLYEKVE